MGKTYADMQGVQDATGFFNITFSESKEDLYTNSVTLSNLFFYDTIDEVTEMPYEGVYRWYDTYGTILYYSKK